MNQIFNLPQEAVAFEIQTYQPPRDIKRLRKTHMPFSGSPRQHPTDNHKIILIPDPYGPISFYYEFRVDDISFAEEMPNLVNMNDEVVILARLWVKKGSVGLRSIPFRVEEISDSDA